MNICQSCAMPLNNEQEISENRDYCIYCFKDGAFTQNMNMEQMIEHCAQFADQSGTTEEEMLEYAKNVFPTLKRWRQA
ncbi:MAG: zinc ribbon domain-containing protein [Clostridiales bacterium]|nr:zinc ribbon domain-containing protein [Clostridiales bacterium]